MTRNILMVFSVFSLRKGGAVMKKAFARYCCNRACLLYPKKRTSNAKILPGDHKTGNP